MQFKFFRIRAESLKQDEEDLNRCLRTVKYVSVYRDFDKEGVWCYAVQYMDDPIAEAKSKGKIDYKNELSEIEFARFRVLRECRKLLAGADNIPPYVIFIDDRIAELSKLETITADDIKKLKGFGEQKFVRFGERFLKLWEENKNQVEMYLKNPSEKAGEGLR